MHNCREWSDFDGNWSTNVELLLHQATPNHTKTTKATMPTHLTTPNHSTPNHTTPIHTTPHSLSFVFLFPNIPYSSSAEQVGAGEQVVRRFVRGRGALRSKPDLALVRKRPGGCRIQGAAHQLPRPPSRDAPTTLRWQFVVPSRPLPAC